MPITTQDCNALINSLSRPRFNAYLRQANNNKQKAIELYQLNTKVSAAFLPSLNICEITIRNAISEVLKKRYGDNWVKDEGLLRALPLINKNNLIEQTTKLKKRSGKKEKEPLTIDEIISELNFNFWQGCCTTRLENRLWKNDLSVSFPFLPQNQTTLENIKLLNKSINKVRNLRNKIAHHGKIFKLDLTSYYDEIIKLIGYRCPVTQSWLKSNTKYLPQFIHKLDRLLSNKN